MEDKIANLLHHHMRPQWRQVWERENLRRLMEEVAHPDLIACASDSKHDSEQPTPRRGAKAWGACVARLIGVMTINVARQLRERGPRGGRAMCGGTSEVAQLPFLSRPEPIRDP